MTKIETVTLPPLKLRWHSWRKWRSCAEGLPIIPSGAGVYEVRRLKEERLTIGKAVNLRRRLRALTGNGGKHSTGSRIRKAEDTAQLLIRWAETEKPAVAEAYLHLNHITRFGSLPIHSKKI